MGCLKVHQLFEHEGYSLKYTPEDLDYIKPLLPSLASKYVAQGIYKHQNMCFWQWTVDPVQKTITFSDKMLGMEHKQRRTVRAHYGSLDPSWG